MYLNCGPLFHIATFFTTLATFVHGGTNVFTPRVDAEELCRLIETERCTGAFLLGPTPKQIRKLNADGRYDLKSLRAYAGAPDWNEMVTVDTSPWARYPGGYGQTEVVGMLTFAALGVGGDRLSRPHVAAACSCASSIPDDRELPAGRGRRDLLPGPARDERLLEPARRDRPPLPQRLAPHQRPRPARGRRLAHVHRAEDADDQVGRREHLPGRGRGLPEAAPRRWPTRR